MDYRETLDYLYAQLPMFQRIGPAAYKKDLGNTLALCEHLGNPHTKFASIHVGGTNGKGSVSHLLAAVYQAAGLKTGLYISPHYKDFRERIKIDGQYIPRRRVVEFVARNRAKMEEIQPSFFELCVAMAFDHFAREKVDIAIVEVGLGGRLDSTNVITPLLSVITNISYDHMNMLGNTLPEIAFEKAGIIKPGVPVVIGETHPESAPVFIKKAGEVGAPIVFADQALRAVLKTEMNWESSVFDIYKEREMFLPDLGVQAAGPYLGKNLVTTLQALLLCGGIPRARDHFAQSVRSETSHHSSIREGFKDMKQLTRFQGRWQVIGQNPVILCDSAHNEAGLNQVFAAVQDMPYPQVHIVTGFVNDKDVDKVLPLFPPQARYYFAKADIPRGLEATLLQEKAARFGLEGKAYISVRNALNAARQAAKPEDLILVTGSIFVVAEVI